MPVARILESVARYKAGHAVVTGGEPMIAPGIAELTAGLRKLDLHITIETAGTVFQPVVCDLMSISPKLRNSTPEGRWATQHERLRLDRGVLRRLMSLCDYQLKFVVTRPEDVVEEILPLTEALSADPRKVILMPEGVDPAVLRERGPWIVELSKRYGFRFSPRLHVDLYGDRRGV